MLNEALMSTKIVLIHYSEINASNYFNKCIKQQLYGANRSCNLLDIFMYY